VDREVARMRESVKALADPAFAFIISCRPRLTGHHLQSIKTSEAVPWLCNNDGRDIRSLREPCYIHRLLLLYFNARFLRFYIAVRQVYTRQCEQLLLVESKAHPAKHLVSESGFESVNIGSLQCKLVVLLGQSASGDSTMRTAGAVLLLLACMGEHVL
jgi:hypothetical protein